MHGLAIDDRAAIDAALEKLAMTAPEAVDGLDSLTRATSMVQQMAWSSSAE